MEKVSTWLFVRLFSDRNWFSTVSVGGETSDARAH